MDFKSIVVDLGDFYHTYLVLKTENTPNAIPCIKTLPCSAEIAIIFLV